MNIYEQSSALAQALADLAQGLNLLDDSARLELSAVAVSLALEHWEATRDLLASSRLPSAVVLHRAQFEATVRSVWLTYAASDEDIAKVSAPLDAESEQSAKNIRLVAEMMKAVADKAPPQAVEALNRFKNASWQALNSYAHAGIHALARHRQGYPVALIENLLRNANGLAVLGYFQLVGICGRQPLQRDILVMSNRFADCLPEPLVSPCGLRKRSRASCTISII